jgi:mono/diheme cytochrome c family protein
MNNINLIATHLLLSTIRLVSVTLFVGMIFSVTAGAAEDAERGAENYQQFCEGCHGADKAGLVNFEGGLEDLQAILDGETNQMPDFYSVFSEDEVADIYAYLEETD